MLHFVGLALLSKFVCLQCLLLKTYSKFHHWPPRQVYTSLHRLCDAGWQHNPWAQVSNLLPELLQRRSLLLFSPMWRRCHWHRIYKIKQGVKDVGRWCSRAGDGTEDQTAVEKLWELRKTAEERGTMHANAARWILASLFHNFVSARFQLQGSLS